MSDRSFRAWGRFSSLARAVLSRPTLFLAQTAADAARLRSLGAAQVAVCGNLKFDAPAPAADTAEVEAMRRAIGARPVLVAASTHPGEDEHVIAAHREVAESGTPLLTIIAPRHRQRGEAIAAIARAAGLSTTLRSRGEGIGVVTDIYLADTVGEMGLWYRLADVAFLGGSLAPRGGQNPIEPAKLGVPIVHGGNLGNFRDVYEALIEAKATVMLGDPAALGASLRRLLRDEAERTGLVRHASDCIGRFTGALDRTLKALDPLLAKPRHSHEASARA